MSDHKISVNVTIEKTKPDKPDKPKPKKVFVWVFVRRKRELITKGKCSMDLENVPFGYQDIYEGKADEDFENPSIENKTGDGEPSVQKTGKATAELTVRGNGTVGGVTAFDLKIDGHIGDGEAAIVTPFNYTTISADATSIGWAKTRREKIPL